MRSLLITGGTGELGTGVVPRLLVAGYRCIVIWRSEEAWKRLQEHAPSDRLAGLTEGTSIDQPIYGVVHLAGSFTMQSSPDDFKRMLDANLMSALSAIESAAPVLEDGGRIVAVSSAASLTRPPGMAAYVAAKSALNSYIEVLAKELRPRKITANAVLPTNLDTPSMRKAMSRELLIPLDRVADTISFLLSDAASAITGQLIALTH